MTEQKAGFAAYCDHCQRFDEAMRVQWGVPHCRFCGHALPRPAGGMLVPAVERQRELDRKAG